MKRTLLFLALIVIGFASCKKDENNYYGPNTPPYHIDGIHDLTIQKGIRSGFYPFMDLTVSYENSDQEKISLSLEGLPQGVYASFSDTSGYPSFSSRLYVADSGVIAGSYTVKLVATGALSGRKEFQFSLKVLPAPVLNAIVSGTGYNSYSYCTGANYIQNVTAVSGTTDHIMFSNFDNTGNQVEGVLSGDIQSGYITIPNQTVNGVTYYNSSSSSYYSIYTGYKEINVTFNKTVSGGGSTQCSIRLTM